MPDPMQGPPQSNPDALSPEDAAALVHAQQQLYSAGDPRAAKLYNYIVSQRIATRDTQGNLTPKPGPAEMRALTPVEQATTAWEPNPRTESDLQQAGTTLHDMLVPINQAFYHPLDTLRAAGLAILHPDAAAHQMYQQAGTQPISTAAQVTGQAIAGAAMEPVVPKITAPIADAVDAGTQVAKNAPGAIAQTTKNVAGKIIPKFDGAPESLMTRAAKPGKNNLSWDADVRQAVPLMKSAEEQLGRPVDGIDDALQAAAAAKKNIWQQYQARLGPAAAQSATIDGNPIADAMMSSIDKRMAIQNPQLVERIQAIADTYRRPIPLNDAEDFIRSNNQELIGYYAKNKMSKQAALADPEVAAKVAEGDALRDALYSKLDDLSGPGAGQLKRAYGALTNIQKELAGRQMVYARQAPVNLPEQLNYWKAGGKILTGNIVGGLKDIAVQRFMSELNDTNSMIARALKASQPAAPFPAPEFRPPIGTAYQLPATSGAPTILPYNPEMTPGEKTAALMQALRQSRAPLALPAQASPIILPPPSGAEAAGTADQLWRWATGK